MSIYDFFQKRPFFGGVMLKNRFLRKWLYRRGLYYEFGSKNPFIWRHTPTLAVIRRQNTPDDLRHTPAGGRGAFVLNILSVSCFDLYIVVHIHFSVQYWKLVNDIHGFGSNILPNYNFAIGAGLILRSGNPTLHSNATEITVIEDYGRNHLVYCWPRDPPDD